MSFRESSTSGKMFVLTLAFHHIFTFLKGRNFKFSSVSGHRGSGHQSYDNRS